MPRRQESPYAGSLWLFAVLVCVVFVSGCAEQTLPTEAGTMTAEVSTNSPVSSESLTEPMTEPMEQAVMMVDGPWYDTVEALAEETDELVSVTVLTSRPDIDGPDFSSDDPVVNPYAGSGESPSPEEIEEMGVAITVYTVNVDMVHAGDLEEGATIEVVEVGGIKGDVEYRVDGMSRLGDQPADLLFLHRQDDGRYQSVGMDQGLMKSDGVGGYRSIDSDRTDLVIASLTDLDDLKRLIES